MDMPKAISVLRYQFNNQSILNLTNEENLDSRIDSLIVLDELSTPRSHGT
jgi:hypothetical protein